MFVAEIVEANCMIDAFAVRDVHDGLYIAVCTFEKFYIRYIKDTKHGQKDASDSADNSITHTMRPLPDRVAINCAHVGPVCKRDGTLIALFSVMGRTDKRLGIHVASASTLTTKRSTFAPQLLDSKEAVGDIDVRAGLSFCSTRL